VRQRSTSQRHPSLTTIAQSRRESPAIFPSPATVDPNAPLANSMNLLEPLALPPESNSNDADEPGSATPQSIVTAPLSSGPKADLLVIDTAPLDVLVPQTLISSYRKRSVRNHLRSVCLYHQRHAQLRQRSCPRIARAHR
jgi:hypothetical protein